MTCSKKPRGLEDLVGTVCLCSCATYRLHTSCLHDFERLGAQEAANMLFMACDNILPHCSQSIVDTFLEYPLQTDELARLSSSATNEIYLVSLGRESRSVCTRWEDRKGNLGHSWAEDRIQFARNQSVLFKLVLPLK